MKAQSIRRLLTLTNALLVVGVAGTVGWWFWKARPALAADLKRGDWVGKSYEAYVADANSARKADFWQVYEKDFEDIWRPDLMDTKSGKYPTAPGVWPFVGPIPPKVEPRKKEEAPKKEAPKGLAAVGRLVTVILPEGDRAGSMLFEFTATKRKRAFAVGDGTPIEDLDPKAKAPPAVAEGGPDAGKRREGKYLVGLAFVGESGDDPQIRVVYDEVGPDPSQPSERKEEVLGITMSSEPSKSRIERPAGAPGTPAGGKPAAGGAPAGGGPRVIPLADVRIAPVEREGRTYIEFDDETFRAFQGQDLERELLKDVKSEDVKEGDGGVRVTSPGNLASKFGVLPGDVLISINGTRVRNRAEALDVVKALPKETAAVSVVLRRDGAEKTYVVDPRDPAVRSAAGKVGFDKR